MRKENSRIFFVVPFAVAAMFALLNLVSFYRTAERRAYDVLLHLRPGVDQHPSILLLDIDDLAIARVGVFPWSRDIVADGLILMREFGARYAVFDIEYVDQSPLGVDAEMLREEIPSLFDREFADINRNVTDLFRALQSGAISLRDAEDYVRDLTELTDSSRRILLDQVRSIARDNDEYLGRAARAFGSAFFTVNMLPEQDEPIPDELRSYVLDELALEGVSARGSWPREAVDIRPSILPVLEGGKGAGFPNVVIDDDGVRRRIELLVKYRDRYYPQLGFSALLDWMGNPELAIRPGALLIRGAELPDGTTEDLRVPMSQDGRLILDWPKEKFLQSYRHLSFWELVLHKRLEENLIHNLEIMEESGFLSFYRGETGLLDAHRYAADLLAEVLAGGDPRRMDEYAQVRDYFFGEAQSFLEGDSEQEILGQIDALISSEDTAAALREQYRGIRGDVVNLFQVSREIAANLARSRETLGRELPGAFCIIGLIGTSTTDIGVTPFEKEYMNVGTHATVVNTILQRSFLDDRPWWYALVAGLIAALAAMLLIRNLEPMKAMLIGVAVVVLIVAGIVALFIVTGIYLNLFTPVLMVFFTFLAVTAVKFLKSEKEKSYIRNAFAHYLSADVINELIADPERLSLGGQEKFLTALFTDVRGFSTISEQLDPNSLVRLLNEYLTGMSDIILSQRGTIDKYEGDAIISFFGAPVDLEDHAARALRSAVRMKKIERVLNEHFLEQKMTAERLLTRIGINSGQMVVGNMGTNQKMDYTIMGNAVNLASRLEGVNKQYGTWVLISESTYKEGGTDFTVRRMDRVRVVGIQQPVRLYELVDEKSETPHDVSEAVNIFHEALDYFEQQEWDRAKKRFRDVFQLLPEDGPTRQYMKRCDNFVSKPPPASWDGVFNLESK
jgi:adenylate cyclase